MEENMQGQQPEGGDQQAKIMELLKSTNDQLSLVGEVMQKLGVPEEALKQIAQASEMYQSAVSVMMQGPKASPNQGQAMPETAGSPNAAPESMQRRM